MDRKNEALNYLKQYPKMDEYLHGCGSNKHKVSGADEQNMNKYVHVHLTPRSFPDIPIVLLSGKSCPDKCPVQQSFGVCGPVR